MTETLNIRVKYRPLKIGMCITNQDFEALRKAVKFNNVFWGGCFNPIIPIDNEDFAKKLISLFRVDFLYPVSVDPKVEEFIKKFKNIPNPFFQKELFTKSSQDKKDSLVLDVYHPIRSIYDEHFKNSPEKKIYSKIYKWDENDSLKDVFLMTLGGYPEKEITPIDYQEILENSFNAEEIKILNSQEHPSDFLEKITPYNLTDYGLDEHYLSPDNWSYHGFYLGNSEDFEDLIYYWNLRATGIRLFFYDQSKAERFKDIKNKYLEKLLATPTPHLRGGGKVGLWGQTISPEEKYTEFGDSLIYCKVSEEMWSGNSIQSPYMYFLEKPVLATLHRNEERTSLAFELPNKSFCYEIDHCRQQHLVVSIHPGIGLFQNDVETLETPYLSELNEYYGRNCFYRWNQARSEPYGLGIIEDIACNSLNLTAIKTDELIQEVFKIKNITATLSQPGVICRHLIQQMGGLRSCQVFKIAGLRNLINKYKASKSFTKSQAHGEIATISIDNSPSYCINCQQKVPDQKPAKKIAGFAKYQNLFIEYRDDKKKLEPSDVFNYMVKKKAFRAGLALNCPSCKLNFWLSLNNLKNEVDCEYCGKNFDIHLQLKDKDWRYRRSGLLGKDNDQQQGAIPVVMLLEQMKSSIFMEDCLYSTAMKLDSKENNINCETDFVILNRGGNRNNKKMQIAIGECKNADEITDDDVKNMKSVIDLLKDQFDIYAIFVKLTKFSDEELKRLKTLNEEYRLRIILFTAKDLETYHAYDEAKQSNSELKKYNLDFDGMACITAKIYYNSQ